MNSLESSDLGIILVWHKNWHIDEQASARKEGSYSSITCAKQY